MKMNSTKLSRLLIDSDTKLRGAFNRFKFAMGKDAVSCSCTNEEVILDTEVLCNDYVEDRLIRSGLQLKKRKIGSRWGFNDDDNLDNSPVQPAISPLRPRTVSFKDQVRQSNPFDIGYGKQRKHDVEAVSKVLLYVGEVLELRHTSTYTDILSQLNITALSEFQLKRAFSAVAREIFASGTSWAKIVSLFAFAGGLSVDCVLNGWGVLVGKIKGWTVAFVASELVNWIRIRGGWTDFVDHFVAGGKMSYDLMAWLFLFACLLLVFILILLILVALPSWLSTSWNSSDSLGDRQAFPKSDKT